MRQKLGRKVVENKQEKLKVLQLLIEVRPGGWVRHGCVLGGVWHGWRVGCHEDVPETCGRCAAAVRRARATEAAE